MANRYRNRRMRLTCIVLTCTTLLGCVWGVVGTVRSTQLSRELAAMQLLAEEGDAQSPSFANAYDPDAIAAEFDGGVVTVGEAAEEYQLIASYYEMLGMNISEYAESTKQEILNGLVEEKLLEIKAKEFGVYELSDARRAELEAQVRAEYEDNLNYYMAFRYEEGKSEDEVRSETEAYLQENGLSYAEMLASAEQEAWRDSLYEYVTADMTLSDEQLRAFYDEQLTSMELTYSASYDEYEADCDAGRTVVWNPEGVRLVQAILIDFDAEQAEQYANLQAELSAGDTANMDQIEALYQSLMPRAQEALSRAQQGEDFEALMSEYGGTGAEGIRISEKSSMYGDAVRDAAMALTSVGDLSGLVECDEGICILRYAGDIAPGAVPYEQVKDSLRANYEDEIKFSQYNATVSQWMEAANIQYHTDRF